MATKLALDLLTTRIQSYHQSIYRGNDSIRRLSLHGVEKYKFSFTWKKVSKLPFRFPINAAIQGRISQEAKQIDVTVKLSSGKRTKKGHKAEQNNIELSINGALSTSRTAIYYLISGAKTEP
ncbi:hypothetical protein POTOM_038742 [Populus tomentosa]|uniref:Uncharacterized protein n=1 Tax=Populus tomentosa TaxID=118781 RepID=A0A8X7YZ75_POPTO|nr:hypothetical protein POTOM_038742 [Populus tomentosa]